jgi:hypothetical protein
MKIDRTAMAVLVNICFALSWGVQIVRSQAKRASATLQAHTVITHQALRNVGFLLREPSEPPGQQTAAFSFTKRSHMPLSSREVN